MRSLLQRLIYSVNKFLGTHPVDEFIGASDRDALGITLPFVVYMGISQTLALILGPVGWAALAGGLLFSLNQPNWNRLELAVIYVSMLRYSTVPKPENA